MKIDVVKQDHRGLEVLRYPGKVISHTDEKIVLEAVFQLDLVNVAGFDFKRGDKMLETFYIERWYNEFEVYAGDSDVLKGWYCNIGYPAVWDGKQVAYRDLALDLLVFADGRQVLLDADEFAELSLPADVRINAQKALAELQVKFSKRFLEND